MDLFEDIVKKLDNGVTINLFVTPNADKCIFPSGYNKWRKRIEIKVCSSAKDNKANREIIKTIANHFNKSAREISIILGEKNREKTIFIKDVSIGKIINSLKESFNGL
jgi:uncharacterized protein (TIGR00251 family)